MSDSVQKYVDLYEQHFDARDRGDKAEAERLVRLADYIWWTSTKDEQAHMEHEWYKLLEARYP